MAFIFGIGFQLNLSPILLNIDLYCAFYFFVSVKSAHSSAVDCLYKYFHVKENIFVVLFILFFFSQNPDFLLEAIIETPLIWIYTWYEEVLKGSVNISTYEFPSRCP
jgi:hypothetical protein